MQSTHQNYRLMQRIILFLFFFLFSTAFAAPNLAPDSVGAKAFILIDADSQRILTQYRADERLNPASITKLMTAYVTYKVLDNGLLSLEDKTIITPNAYNMTEGSRMFLERGSRVSINELLHGLVIQSGNDAAVALAEAIGGSEKNFVGLMNQYAKALGMTNSQFKNVTGLTAEGHYMSAHDIATLARAIITEFPEHYQLYKEKSYTWNNITQNNRNALLKTDPTVDGLKTGYTEAAGYCLTASAKRDDMRLISVVLGTRGVVERVRASRKVLNFGYQNFVERTLVKAHQKMATAAVAGGVSDRVDIAASQAIRIPISREDKKQLSAQLMLDESLQAPLTAGQTVGKIVIKIHGKIITSVPAVTMQAVDELGFFSRMWNGLFD